MQTTEKAGSVRCRNCHLFQFYCPGANWPRMCPLGFAVVWTFTYARPLRMRVFKESMLTALPVFVAVAVPAVSSPVVTAVFGFRLSTTPALAPGRERLLA